MNTTFRLTVSTLVHLLPPHVLLWATDIADSLILMENDRSKETVVVKLGIKKICPRESKA